jgi:hypothetical protein
MSSHASRVRSPIQNPELRIRHPWSERGSNDLIGEPPAAFDHAMPVEDVFPSGSRIAGVQRGKYDVVDVCGHGSP